MSIYRCETGYCGNIFEHPGDDDCPLVEGMCAHLMEAGWRPVWLRVTTDDKKNRHIFSRGGWICPNCVKHYRPKRKR